MKNKKTVLIHSNFCKAFTGFGKNKKNILRYLYSTEKYNIVEAANGLSFKNNTTESTPWTCYGTLPNQSVLNGLNQDQLRSVGYGGLLIDEIINITKPDVYIGIEDIWAFSDFHKKSWWNNINCMIWTTLDSLPILPQAIEYAPKIKNYYIWSSFAEKEFKKIGYVNIKTLHGSIETKNFFRLSDEERLKLRENNNLDQDSFIIGFVFRNQLRKSVPNLLDGFKKFKDKNPDIKAKLLLHTYWQEGWDITRLLEEKGIDSNDIITTYVCNQCGKYEIKKYVGENQNCRFCKSEKSSNTTNVSYGVSEKQLNEIYNLMDVYCHPFTSGGQEIPIQEAKLTELITLVTNYSCGEENCTEESGGIPLNWHEYREPGTQFIKASTDASSIAENLEKVHKMTSEKRSAIGLIARQWVIDNFSVEAIGKKLEEIIDNMPEHNFDFSQKIHKLKEEYTPYKKEMSIDEFVIDIHKYILNEDIDKNSSSFKQWKNKLINNEIDHNKMTEHFINLAKQQNNNEKIDFASMFSSEDENKRIAVLIPQSETDVFLINSLIKNLKKQYPEYNIYIFTSPKYFEYIEDNPYVYKCLPYSESLDNFTILEGIGENKGFFEMAFYPCITTQKNVSYIHNGKNKNQFSLYN
jgi:glycosyltransferase involved in cell wall biosynthesis